MRQPTAPINFYKWNRKILNAYWMIALLTVSAEIIGLFLTVDPLKHYVVTFMIEPTFLILAAIGLAEWINKARLTIVNYFMLLTGTFITAVIVKVNAEMHGIQFIFLLPLLVSVLYFQKRKVMLSFAMNVLTYVGLYEMDAVVHQNTPAMDAIVTIIVFFGGYIIVRGIMSRGIEIQRDLISTIEKQQDLVMRSAMMEWLSKTDALTDLYNHKTFHEYLDKLVEQTDQYGLTLQLAIFDVDNFKRINDTYGHWVGDIILRRVAAAIKSNVAPDDIVSRYGGEEFAVIFTDKQVDDAYRLCEKTRLAIASEFHEELAGNTITISIGLQPYIQGKGKEQLFKGADQALYRVKRTGKNRTVMGELPASVANNNEDTSPVGQTS